MQFCNALLLKGTFPKHCLTVTFDQFNAPLINKTIKLIEHEHLMEKQYFSDPIGRYLFLF